jgi:dihydroxyacetone kinase
VFVFNYTGDCLNFGVAVEQARVILPPAPLEMVVLEDDIALINAQMDTVAGRRGLAGSAVVLKVLCESMLRFGEQSTLRWCAHTPNEVIV